MKKHLTKILSVFVALAILLGSASMLVTYTKAYNYIAYGIDVSAWQGNINWTSVKADGIDFAILRIMASGKDKYFESNYTNAKAAGVKLGVYCYSYADTVAEAQAEANKVLSWLGGRTLEYPVYYDIEDANQNSLTNAQRTELCIAFCDVIEAAGYRAGIYSGTYWFNSKLDRATLTAKYEIWEAMWPTSGNSQVGSPIYDKSSTCGMWQYTSEGNIAGISGNVDRNVSYKDYASYMIANGYNGYGSSTGISTLNGYYQTTGSVNFRTGPSTSYDIITTLAVGTQVAVVGFDSTGTWAKVSYNGSIGYISKNYLAYIRAFTYSVNYLTNNANTMDAQSIRYGSVLTVPTPAADPDGKVFKGWQLLRYTDFLWYTGSTWDAGQGNAKLFQPGEQIVFSDEILNSAAGDDLFYLCAVWGTATAPTISTVTSSEVSPSKYGWKWPSGEAYGYMGNYGGNGQDIELCVDLCLLPSSETSSAAFYANGTDSRIVIDPSSVTLGSTSVSYDWGELSLNNWHDVKFKLINNYAYVFIDGELIASGSGFAANESYQLLFSLTGEMAVDNAMLYRSDGHCFFNIDFENATDAQKVMGEGLGSRTLLFPDTSDFTVSISPSSSAIKGTGDVTYVATPSAGEGHTYSWSSSNSALNSYMRTSGNTCTIDIPAELAGALSSTITCTVTSNGGVTNSASATLTYAPNPAPILSSITPSASSITGTGSATYTAAASGDGLTYNWSSSNSALNAYLSGVNTNKLTVNIPTELSSALSATITCTVTNSYGKTATKTATFSYTPAPAPTISAVTPSSASLTDSGTVTYKVTAEGEGLTYSWTCSDSSLNAYVTGADTDTVTISIPDKLSGAITAAFTCTVTNSYGKTAQSDPAILVYTVSEDTGDISVIILGDANGDGEIKTADSLIAKRIAAGIDTPTPEQEKALDVNGDGKINSADTNLISRFIAGIIIEF